MPACCSIPPCLKKVSEGLQQVAESYNFPTSSSISQPPAQVPPRRAQAHPKNIRYMLNVQATGNDTVTASL